MQIIRGDYHYIAECIAIAKELNEYFNEDGMNKMKDDLQKQLLYVAKNSFNSEVTGFITVDNQSTKVVEISWMAIKRDCQQQGIGKELINHVFNDLKQEGVRLLKVKTLSANVDYPPYESTRKFYEVVGFILFETIDPYEEWGTGNPCAIYVKILD
ncbi:MAG: GNAT family N-acetyltransferase [Halanaerobiales bacterium]|nr:GNAT family N-acetyltransferase [Halanaerobiales bacterium]